MRSAETRAGAAFHYLALAMALCTRDDVVTWADQAFMLDCEDQALLELTLARAFDDNDVMRLLKSVCEHVANPRGIELVVTAIAIDLSRGETLRWVEVKLRELGLATGTTRVQSLSYELEIDRTYAPRPLADAMAHLHSTIATGMLTI